MTTHHALIVDVENLTPVEQLRLRGSIDRLVEGILADRKGDSVDPDAPGWTVDTLLLVLKRLRSDGRGVQADVIEEALEQGGTIGRDDVYEIAGYGPDRSLKGFTRPVLRHQGGLVDEGLLDADAPELLKADYDPAVKGFQRTLGFHVPHAVAELRAGRGSHADCDHPTTKAARALCRRERREALRG